MEVGGTVPSKGNPLPPALHLSRFAYTRTLHQQSYQKDDQPLRRGESESRC